jgi:hypothetical protein
MATVHDERRLLTTRQAAEVLAVHPDTLVRLAAEQRALALERLAAADVDGGEWAAPA